MYKLVLKIWLISWLKQLKEHSMAGIKKICSNRTLKFTSFAQNQKALHYRVSLLVSHHSVLI